MNLKQPLFHPPAEVDADRAHVAYDLRGRFLIGEEQRALPPAAGRLDELGSNAALARAWRAGDKDAAAAKDSLVAQHLVETWDASRNVLGRGRVVQPERRDGQNRD